MGPSLQESNTGNDIKRPTGLLTTSSTERMAPHWTEAHAGSTFDSGNCHGTIRLCYSFPYRIVYIFTLFLFPGSNRFHHLKEFPYNYEGETVSSVAGASSARSGLKIRARCVVKSVAPCQHVLKVRYCF